jgi:hypothetical protein
MMLQMIQNGGFAQAPATVAAPVAASAPAAATEVIE